MVVSRGILLYGKKYRIPRRSNLKRWFKRYANKRVRHSDVASGRAYKRVTDGWYWIY